MLLKISLLTLLTQQVYDGNGLTEKSEVKNGIDLYSEE